MKKWGREGISLADIMRFSNRVSRISMSSTASVLAAAVCLRAQGIDVVDFGPGEPDFPTPDNIKRAAVEAIQSDFMAGPQDSIGNMLRKYARRREYIVKALNAIPGIRCNWPDGAFYVYPNISAFLGNSTIRRSTFHTPSDFSHRLLQNARVAVVPREAFGTQEHIRISNATSQEQIEQGVQRLKELCRGL